MTRVHESDPPGLWYAIEEWSYYIVLYFIPTAVDHQCWDGDLMQFLNDRPVLERTRYEELRWPVPVPPSAFQKRDVVRRYTLHC